MINREKWKEELYERLDPDCKKSPGGGKYWISVEEGWKKLICNLVDRLDEMKLPYTVLQVKEKFGTLRFYVHCEKETPAFLKAIARAERASAKICEDCGKKGKIRGDSWIRTLCLPCDRKFKEVRAERRKAQ